MSFCLFPAETSDTFYYCSITGFHGYKTTKAKAKIYSDCLFFVGKLRAEKHRLFIGKAEYGRDMNS